MFKYVALYREPPERDSFDRDYFATHVPLVEHVPGIVRTEVARVSRQFSGDTPWYFIAELYFNSSDDFRSATRSEQWKALGANLGSWGGLELVTTFTADVLD